MIPSSPYKKSSFIWSVSAVALLAAGCTDHTFDPKLPAQSKVQFEVSINDIWNHGDDTSRADKETDKPEPIELSYQDTRLYLVESNCQEEAGMSRGSVLEDESVASFGVFASVVGSGSGPDYMYNEEVTSKNSWTPVDNYMWPGQGQLHINAYVPYVSEPQESEGITSLPSVAETGDLTITYKVPANVDEQEDLMWSTPCDASESPCKLTFNHALTAIRIFSGSELTPCTVQEISIRNVLDQGVLNLETGAWSDTTGNTTYTIRPQVVLAAADSQKYVTAGTPIVDGDNTFIVLPQVLGSDASISVTLDIKGTTTVLEAPLYGQEWSAGKVINYRLSANPDSQSLTLDVTGKFASNYYLGTDNFTVKSNLQSGGSSTPVKWIAEFVDDNGNVIGRPDWIADFPTSGDGDTDCTATTVLQDPDFLQMSPETKILQDTPDINSTSGFTPYNLSSSTGSASIENTANCYVINAPGRYSLPLVYGNAIKNGATNSGAYTSTSHNRAALKTFVNHLNNGITDPYIYNNSGCTPGDAVLLWEAELSLIRNVSLSDDRKSIVFEVPHSTIRQGNAVIAVRDASGNVMWSWHIWVTDYKAGSGTANVSVSGKTYGIYPRCIGQVNGGDITDFKPRSVKVRFTQTDVPDGLEPLQKTMEFTQNGITITKNDRYTYYQWGRKDPIVPDAEEWYDATHQEIHTLTQMHVTDVPSGMSLEQYWTLDPFAFWVTDHNYNFTYTNLWNINLSATSPQKTVYDPSPAGSMMPSRNVMRGLISESTLSFSSSASGSEKAGFYLDLSGDKLWFAPLGYRSGATGNTTSSGSVGEYWCCESVSTSEAAALVMSSSGSVPSANVMQEARSHGFGVRPMVEP
ncbi:MAG: fimbrillin family protein [Muribaculaceae bacterium]|nr:fimbrillin family protein [Muribaculaceae bacterium]